MGIRAQRALIIQRLGRPHEALAEVTAALTALQKMRATLGPYWLAQARLAHGRILVDIGRPHEAEPPLQAAADWFNRYGADSPRHAEARCALGLVQMLAGARTEGAAALDRWFPTYRVWGQADRRLVAQIERATAGAR